MTPPLRPLTFAVALAASIGAAGATENIACSGVDGSDAYLEMNASQGMPVTFVSWVRVSAGGREWSSIGPDAGTIPVNLYQAFDDGETFLVDVADEPVTRVIMKIRIHSAEEKDRVARVGTLHIVGDSVHPLVCDFGENPPEDP
jgi:hypothetical protein